nr:cytochrome P450 4V2-like isoform X2 [Helicoverpa armigera]WRX05996.1 CYP340J2 [Helicoverpa armigera]
MFAVLVCFVFLVIWSWMRMRRKSMPPVLPGALPLIGNSHQLIGDRIHLWKFVQEGGKFCQKQDGVATLMIGNYPFYLVTDPDDCLVVSNASLNKPYVYKFGEKFLGNGLITSDETIWKPHRKLLNPTFNQQIMNTFLHEMNVQARALVTKLSAQVDKGPFDPRPYFVDFTLSTVSRTSLGLNAEDQTIISNEYANMIEEIFGIYCKRFQKVWLHLSCFYNFSPMKWREEQLIKSLRKILDNVIHKRRAELKQIKHSDETYDSSSGKFTPALDHMLNMADEQNAFTDQEIREHIDSLIAAAYDTSSTTLTYALNLLGSNPHVQDRVLKELEEVLQDKNADITKDNLQNLVYLDAVVKETLRLYSAIPFIGRKVEFPVKLKKYTLEPGTTCMLLLQSIHLDPKLWGPDVNEFKPERWLNPDTLPKHPNAYVPFGVGRRYCIGRLYTTYVMKTALAHMLRRFVISGDITKVVTQYDIVLKPVIGHHISLKLRT